MTHHEKQADRLWAQFDKKQQDHFWQKYEVLVKRSKTSTIPTENAPQRSKAQTLAKTHQTVFHPHISYLAEKIFLFILPPSVAMLIFMLDSSQLNKGEALGLVFIGLVLWSLYGFFLFMGVNTIRVSQTHLILGNPSKQIPWNTIKSVIVNSYVDVKDNVAYDFVITTKDQYQHARTYKLSKKNHQLLFAHIAQKVTTVDAGNYPGDGM